MGAGEWDREEKEANKGCVKLVSTVCKFSWEAGKTVSHLRREGAGVHPVRSVTLSSKCKEGCLTSATDTTNAGEQRTRDARSPWAWEKRSALGSKKLLQYPAVVPVTIVRKAKNSSYHMWEAIRPQRGRSFQNQTKGNCHSESGWDTSSRRVHAAGCGAFTAWVSQVWEKNVEDSKVECRPVGTFQSLLCESSNYQIIPQWLIALG